MKLKLVITVELKGSLSSKPPLVGVLLKTTCIANIPWVNPPVVKAGVVVISAGGGEGLVSIHVCLLVAYLPSSSTL